MKFIKLESRGGNYLVVAQNVAWLRTAENGQTNVGIIGGQPLLVIGSVEEVAEKILAGMAEAAAEAASAPPAPVSPPTAASPPIAAPALVAVPAPAAEPAPSMQVAPTAPPPAPAPQREPEPEPVLAEASEPEPEPDLAPSQPKSPPAAKPGAARPRVASARSASMWERPAAPPKVKVTSQRMMGRFE